MLKVMNNHCYSVDGANKVQLEGGPIGLKLSGALAKVVMLSWSRKFKTILSAALEEFAHFNLYLLLFYVDDTGVAVEELEPGCRFIKEEGKVRVIEEEVEGDRRMPGDLRTAKVLADVANSIFDYIQFTVDCPSNHASGWMPLLATQVRVAADNTIDYKFFEKEIASKYVMMRNSAMSARVKMNCLTQEVIRRLRNTRESLDWNEFKAPILTKFCKKMARSGYPESYRAEVIKSGVVGYERQLEASRSGEKPLFRPRDWKQEERRRRKLVRKTSWYRPADCVGFYPPTPAGELNQGINQVLKEEGRRIGMNLRAIETGGVSLGRMLVHPDLKRGEPCGRPGCVLDRTSGGAGGPHNVPSILYRGECKLCEAQGEAGEYWGESGFSVFHRCEQHKAEVVNKKDSNAFAKHLAVYHPNEQGNIENFNIKVESVFKKPLTRQKTEAVKIQSSTATYRMNSKAEHRQPAMLRVRMTRENDDDGAAQQQRGRGRGGRGAAVERGGMIRRRGS